MAHAGAGAVRLLPPGYVCLRRTLVRLELAVLSSLISPPGSLERPARAHDFVGFRCVLGSAQALRLAMTWSPG